MTRDYLSFNVTLSNILEATHHLKVEDNVDALIQNHWETIEKACVEAEVDPEVMDLIFGMDAMIHRGASDSEIMDLLDIPYASKVAQLYADIERDRYAIDFMLRHGMNLPIRDYGAIKAIHFTNAKRVDDVIQKTPYFRKLKHVRVETINKLMDEILYESLQIYRHQGVGIDGISSKILICMLYLKQHRIVWREKHHAFPNTQERNYEN